MANRIALYKTNLNRENRMINQTALVGYLATCTVQGIDTTYPIMPNVPFVIDISEFAGSDIFEYNYLMYFYGSTLYYSFIDSIDFLANENKVRINHTTDYWTMSGGDMSKVMGTVTRGLLDEYAGLTTSGNYYPNFLQTMNTPEEQFTVIDLVKAKYRLNLKGILGDNYDQLWLYIYVANPYSVLDTWVLQSSLNGVPNMGLTLCYPVVYYGHSYWVVYFDSNNSPTAILLSSITNSDLTSMLITPLPPVNADHTWTETSVTISSTSVPVYYNSNMVKASVISTATNMPPYANYYPTLEGFVCNTENMFNGYDSGATAFGNGNDNSYIRLYGRYTQTNTLDNYLSYHPKALSSVYNPVYIEDLTPSYYDLSVTKEFFTLYLSADLTCYGYTMTAASLYGTLGGMHKKQITSTFSPTVLQDYWTRLNASIESISAQGTKTKAVINGISSVLTGITGAISTGLNAGMAITNAGIGGLSAINQGINTLSNTASDVVDSYYSYEIADRQQEIADYQYRTGLTDETAAMYLNGMFDFTDLPTVYSYTLPLSEIKDISYKLATKGCNCNLDFTNYWNNLHTARQYYEYLEMKDVVVIGANAQMQRAIQEMFAHGVRLWYFVSGAEIGNPYAVANYPVIG